MALRGAAVAVLAAEAALTALPNAAVLLRACMYSDGPASLVRWSSAARQALAFAFIALKGSEVRPQPQPSLCTPPRTVLRGDIHSTRGGLVGIAPRLLTAASQRTADGYACVAVCFSLFQCCLTNIAAVNNMHVHMHTHVGKLRRPDPGAPP